MKPSHLKRSIIELAIQGKLIESVQSDGDSAILIRENNRVATEEARIRGGKLGTKENIQQDSLPFDIPDHWQWECFGNLVVNFDSHRKPVSKSERVSLKGEYGYYGATGQIDQVDDFIFDGEYLMIGEDGGNFYTERDNAFIVSGRFWANNHVHVVQPIVCDAYYLKFCLDSYNLPGMGLISGIAVPKLNQKNMNSIPIPVPPLSEQKRIVAKINELLPYIDCYEQAWTKLETFNKRFPADMQKSILQHAIQGKLVEQRQEEGTGADLYMQIQEEKKRLIKSGAIKKEKPLPEITDDEKPFDIPENWGWVRIGEISTVRGGKRIPVGRQLTEQDTGYKYIRVTDMKNGTIKSSNQKFVPRDIYPSIKAYTISKDDVYITVAGTIGQSGLVPDEYHNANLTENADKLIVYDNDKEFIHFALQSEFLQNQIKAVTTKVGQPKLAIARIQQLVIPLPPKAEQQRIVERIKRLLALSVLLEH